MYSSLSLFSRANVDTYITQIPTRVVMVDHMGSAKENQMDSIMNGKGGDLFVWEEGVHGKSISHRCTKIATTHIK